MSKQIFEKLENIKEQYDETIERIENLISKPLHEYLKLKTTQEELFKKGLERYSRLDISNYTIEDIDTERNLIWLKFIEYVRDWPSSYTNEMEISIPISFLIDENYRKKVKNKENDILEEENNKKRIKLEQQKKERQQKEYENYLILKQKYENQ